MDAVLRKAGQRIGLACALWMRTGRLIRVLEDWTPPSLGCVSVIPDGNPSVVLKTFISLAWELSGKPGSQRAEL
jgi:hypothetical protein